MKPENLIAGHILAFVDQEPDTAAADVERVVKLIGYMLDIEQRDTHGDPTFTEQIQRLAKAMPVHGALAEIRECVREQWSNFFADDPTPWRH